MSEYNSVKTPLMGQLCSGQESWLQDNPEAVALTNRLAEILQERPYLERTVHPLYQWVQRCRHCIETQRLQEAEDHLRRVQAAIRTDDKRLRSAFDKFDADRSGVLEVAEFRHFVTYLGFSSTTVENLLRDTDKNTDGVISIAEFQQFIGRMGGIHAVFEQRRNHMGIAPEEEEDNAKLKLVVGMRVRAHFMEQDGGRSDTVWDARLLAVDEDNETVKVEFGTGAFVMKQDIPIEWVQEDLDVVEALANVGIMDDAQHYWTILLPQQEQEVLKSLTPCQQTALCHTRTQASASHNEAIDELRERCQEIGITNEMIWSVLTWIRDLAPVIVMVDMDKVGEFFESDTHYRNQFETKSSNGLLSTSTREDWERDLFGGCYDNAQAFERPKYGVLDVMNDNRGVICARQYGDSYLVLKNARLRCTFAPEDSGGICGSRLAVLDQYAHVLAEYSDEELCEVARVANAPCGSKDRIGDSEKLESYNYKEAQIHGEVDLSKHVKRLVVHPRHRVDGFNPQRVKAVCEKHGWEFMWMDDERDRRIHEEREAKDRKTLKMSWGDSGTNDVPKSQSNRNQGQQLRSITN